MTVQQKKQKRRQRQQHEKTESDGVGESSDGGRGTEESSDGEGEVERCLSDTGSLERISNGSADDLLKPSRCGVDEGSSVTHCNRNEAHASYNDVISTSQNISPAASSPLTPPKNGTSPSKPGPRSIDPCRGDNRRKGHSPVHYPSKVTYSLGNVFKDLLNFAAQNLVVGGHLVFWLPVNRYSLFIYY